MHILYISTSCSEKKYQYIYELRKVKAIEPQQKFNWLLEKGLSEVHDTVVTALCGLPVSHSTCNKKQFEYEHEIVTSTLAFEYMPFRNGRVTRLFDLLRQSKRYIKKWLKQNSDKPSCIVVDVLSPFLILGGFGYAKRYKVPVIGIVTDLPELATGMKERRENIVKKVGLKIIHKLNTWTLTKYDGYISLTESINEVVNTKKKPELVIEGSVNGIISYSKKSDQSLIVVYAGGVYEKYGLKNLVEAFETLDTKAELHIYGDGTYVDTIKKKTLNYPNIKYMGMASLEEIVEIEKKATLLVNPRPSTEEFSKYSFPSKTLEYMSSGTPLLSTRLPGIPEEYFNYIFTIDDESVSGIAESLERVLSLPAEVLINKGKSAYDFVMKEKNNIRQGEKIVHFIKNSFYA